MCHRPKKYETSIIVKDDAYTEGEISYNKEDYLTVQKLIDDLYYEDDDYYSSAMDILASYVKGQKLIYMESKFYCETLLNILMLIESLFP